MSAKLPSSFLSNRAWTPATLLMKNLWRTSAEPLRVVLAPSPSLSVLFSDTASAIETTAPNHSFMPLWLSGGKIHHFGIESQGEGTTPFLVQAVAASRLRRSLHACIVAGFSGQTVYEERTQISSSRHEARMTWGTGGWVGAGEIRKTYHPLWICSSWMDYNLLLLSIHF